MSEILCDCCKTEGDHPSRMICDACFASAMGQADCCLATQIENKQLKEALEDIIEYWNKDENSMAMSDALWHMLETAEQALRDPK